MKDNKLILTIIGVIIAVFILMIGIFTFMAMNSTTKTTDTTADNTETTATEEVAIDGKVKDETHPIATVKIKDIGTMTFELYPEEAPETVNNFISLANKGFYNGLTMHRIIPGFVAQGGDPQGDGTGGPGYSIKGEFTSNGVNNKLTHQKGAIAMARGGTNDSAGSQFYINLAQQDSLDGQYAVFGYMLTGEDVLPKLEKLGTDSGTPTEKVTIESVSVDTKGKEYSEPNKLDEQ